jgi:hypothetical protein
MHSEAEKKERDQVLSEGEWHALIFQVPRQVQHLVTRLALHHGHLSPVRPEECPVCGSASKHEVGQMELIRH